MSDMALIEMERVETFEREESRFEQKSSKSLYCPEAFFRFPKVMEDSGVTSFDISIMACLFGIQTPVHISGVLFSKWIMNGVRNPIKNIETLCHAFLYAVDCDSRNSCILEFIVPGNGTPAYTVSAILHGFRKQFISLSWEP